MAPYDKLQDRRTFAEAGIPFPLYEAPISSCSSYMGRGTCSAAAPDAPEEEHCFAVAALFTVCTSCGVRTAGLGERYTCHLCGAAIPAHLGSGGRHGQLTVSYRALREGLAGSSVDTEFGAVWPALALQGRTHGVPGLSRADLGNNAFEIEATEEEGWMAVRIPADELLKLVSTPLYITWQGERWLFHCSRAMVFVGEPRSSELLKLPLESDAGRELAQLLVHGELETGLMTFRCVECGLHRFHFDLD